jgi:hydrogenase maturation factor
MNCGRLTESIYERSINKVVKTNSTKNRKFYDGAGLGADCAILTETVSGQAVSIGNDKNVTVRSYMASLSSIIASYGISGKYASLTLLVPLKLREIKVRSMIEAVTLKAEEMEVPILGCNVQVLPNINETTAVCTVIGSDEKQFNSKANPNEDIVMTKWIGIEGTAIIADKSRNELCERYPVDIVDEAVSFYSHLSIAPEAAGAIKSGASYMKAVREGGIFGGLWQLASDNGVGLVADLKSIPVRQETIELCEFFDLNPYELIAGGSLLITTSNGGELVNCLNGLGILATVIGKTMPGNDRIIRHDDELRFLEPAKGDEIYRYYNILAERNSDYL